MAREVLHQLVDRIPEAKISAAQRFPENLAAGAALRAALAASPDDELVADGDADAIARARADLDAGKVVPHEEILREFGI
jgi:predicted transcriptional regulator